MARISSDSSMRCLTAGESGWQPLSSASVPFPKTSWYSSPRSLKNRPFLAPKLCAIAQRELGPPIGESSNAATRSANLLRPPVELVSRLVTTAFSSSLRAIQQVVGNLHRRLCDSLRADLRSGSLASGLVSALASGKPEDRCSFDWPMTCGRDWPAAMSCFGDDASESIGVQDREHLRRSCRDEPLRRSAL